MHRTIFLFFFFLLLALAGIYSLPARADLTVGATREIPDGKLDYTPAVADLAPESGQYPARIPLEVLPGPAGQAPSLALVYSAKRTNGPLGAGWGLSFESSIERKSKYGGIADMSADDTFWIDGQKLIEVEDGSYRTEQNDHTRYTKVTGPSGLTGWKALKDGFTRHYGITAGAVGTIDANAVEYRNETSDSGTAAGTREVRWHLSKTRTAFGVEVSYRYIIPEIRPNGETSLRHLPDKIIYAETSSGWNEVSFAYEERNDIRVSYANGPKRVESKRLGSIVVKRLATTAVSPGVVSGTAVSPAHEYLLIYGNASNSPQSLLTDELASPFAQKDLVDHAASVVVADPHRRLVER